MNKQAKNSGFTLVELIISVGITAVLMIGISSFFSTTFRNMFMAREKVTNTQGQFLLSAILSGKFEHAEALDTNNSCGNECAVLQSDMESGDLPYTYIGKETIDGAEHVVFKDFFVFNGQEGSVSSKDSSAIENPGGITESNGEYYVTAPLENKIYICGSPGLNACNDLNIEGLDEPIDIADNGMAPPNDVLYVSDAGNNRILLIKDPTGALDYTEEITADLNFPTGLEYYSVPGSEFLFVSDTYHHQVKKVDLSTSNYKVIAGNGEDKLCDPSDGRDHSAESCKLSFPTGLVIGDAGSGNELYIADTGNRRILKVTDPNPDLTDVEFQMDLGNPTQVKRVDFVFPGTTTINSVTQGVSSNTMHKTKYGIVDSTITGWLSGLTTSNYIVPVCGGDPEVCTDYFRGFYVNDANNIFDLGNNLDIDGSAYTTDIVSSEGPDNWKVTLTPLNTTIDPPADTEVRITDTFSGQQSFYLDLTDVDFGSYFNSITAQAFNEADLPINDPPTAVSLRIGDGKLGTQEDTISQYPDETTFYPYPTDVSWYSGAPSFSGWPAYLPAYDTNFTNYDYTSDFEIDNFEFSTINGGNILELNFDAKLSEDAEGNEEWQSYTLNADIAP